MRIRADCLAHTSWRRNRRAAREGLTRSACRSYHTILQKESVLLASALLESPGSFEKLFQRTAASSTLSILYDYPTLENDNDKTLKGIHAFLERMSFAAAPGSYLVELMPWMMHIPERSVLIVIGCCLGSVLRMALRQIRKVEI